MNTKTTPINVTKLESNQVFVFGSNATGFHGAGAAGLACRGVRDFNWRGDQWFLNAMNSSVGSSERIGKWAIYGIARGFQQGREGMSYAIETTKRPGQKRSTSLSEIETQIITFLKYARDNPQLEFLVVQIGSKLAGYLPVEIRSLFLNKDIPNNVSLPKEYL